MFKINSETNEIFPLETKTFSQLGFSERHHLQEWISKHPACLGEDFLIIQKEFSGFSDTNERLDLLALDKSGSLVVIENKLDDTGRDVTWQALKYASYCSSLNKETVKQIFQQYLDKSDSEQRAEESLAEFFELDYQDIQINKSFAQRIILIAANFRKEVTSTVLWLMNYKLRIQCFKVTPYTLNNQSFLNFEQIIPIKDTEDFTIKIAEKAQDELSEELHEQNRFTVRRKFWSKLLQQMQSSTSLFSSISPGKSSYLNKASGLPGVSYRLKATGNSAKAEIYINCSDPGEGDYLFNQLFFQKEAIEQNYGGELIWLNADHRRHCRISAKIEGDIFDETQWNHMIIFMIENIIKLERAFKNPISRIAPYNTVRAV